MVDAKIITQSDVILKIERKYLRLPEGQEDVMGSKSFCTSLNWKMKIPVD